LVFFMIKPTNRKNLLTFGGDPVPDTLSPLSPFSRHCGIGNFMRFILSTQSPADFHDTRRND